MAKHALRQGVVPASSLPSLLALSIASALAVPAVYAAPAASDTIVVDAAADSGTPDESQDYSVKTTTSGTKMLLVPRDIPQSVSVISQQRMQDQQLTTIEDVLENTTGVTASRIDTSRTNFFARGFYISNFAYEDMPTFLDNRWNFGDTAGDTAIYDKIEIVRGAAGLMSGTGNPSAYVNMVRKHADSQTFKGNVSATYGNWDKQRYVMDVQSPLVESGKVRGRVVAGYQDNDSFVERNHYRKNSFMASWMPTSPSQRCCHSAMTIRKAKKTARPGAASLRFTATAAGRISAAVLIPPPTGPTPISIPPKFSPT